jgi:copper homeostasis protein
MQLELCASTPIDVAVAREAGADRVELCGHWECGGLTPTPAVVRVCASIGIPIRALIRPRAGHFFYDSTERHLILAESLDSLEAGAEKVVFGGLRADGDLDEELLEMLVKGVGGENLVMHRAIDVCADPIKAGQLLLDYGVNEVLTSGGAPAAGLGLSLIKDLSSLGLEVIAGCGVRPDDVVSLGEAGVAVVHAGCRVKELPEGVEVNSELFDLNTHPLDFDKAAALTDAVYNWNNTEDEE